LWRVTVEDMINCTEKLETDCIQMGGDVQVIRHYDNAEKRAAINSSREKWSTLALAARLKYHSERNMTGNMLLQKQSAIKRTTNTLRVK